MSLFVVVILFSCRPTELDAVVYGHLFTIITTTLPVDTVAKVVENFPNLVRFCQDIDDKYFKDQTT